MWGREAHVSLRHRTSAVTLGRQYTVAHTLAARFQPQGNPNSAVYSVFSSHHIARQDNMLRLDAQFAGLDWVASVTLGEQAASDSANRSWALGVGITRPGWSAAAYAQQMNNITGAETRKILGTGGQVKLNPTVTLFGGAMQRSAAVSAQKNRVLTLGANVVLNSRSTLSLAAFDDRQSGSTTLQGQRRVAWASVNYSFSRRTDLYATVDHNRVSGGYARPAFMARVGTQTGVAAGLRHRF
jgi:predicted porin